MAQTVNEPSLRDDLHPGADTGGTGADPHQAEIAILKCFEYSAQRRRWHGLRAVFQSDVYLRTSASTLCLRSSNTGKPSGPPSNIAGQSLAVFFPGGLLGRGSEDWPNTYRQPEGVRT